MIKGEEIKIEGRCYMCDDGRMISGQDGWSFPSCYHAPYKGKWCAEIKECPKKQEAALKEAQHE